MKLWRRLEDSLQNRIEGLFGKRFQGRIQPVEIAKRLVRAMKAGRNVSVTVIYVPNCFEVFLGPEDWEGISPLVTTFSRELEGYLAEKAAAEGYQLVGKPEVHFTVDESLSLGSIRVDSWFSEKITAAGTGSQDMERVAPGERPVIQEQTRVLPREPLAGLALTPVRTGKYWLYVVSGPDRKQAFPLEDETQVIGRKGDSDIQLCDPRVSRRHARLELEGGKLVLTDLGSLNGTFVNGSRTERAELKTGDLIRLGETVLEVKED